MSRGFSGEVPLFDGSNEERQRVALQMLYNTAFMNLFTSLMSHRLFGSEDEWKSDGELEDVMEKTVEHSHRAAMMVVNHLSNFRLVRKESGESQ